MFSEMTRMRPAWARSPDAAIAIDLRKSTAFSWFYCGDASALTHRRLDKAETALIERGHGLVVELVAGDLDHLVFEVDGVAGRADVGTESRHLEPGRAGGSHVDVRRLGAGEPDLSDTGRPSGVELQRGQILRAE